MSTLTALYDMVEIKPGKSHRMDCIAKAGSYPVFERMAARSRCGRLFFYATRVPDRFSVNARMKAGLSITNGKNISSVYFPDKSRPLVGFGDVKGTNDALLFIFNPDYSRVEVYVAPGMKRGGSQFASRVLSGEFNREISYLRGQKRQP